jgi:hypothetical protein
MLIGLATTMTVSGQPTPNSDSNITWIPRVDAKRVFARALEANALREIIDAKEKDILSLTERIDGLKQIISVMQEKDVLSKSVVQSYENQIKELKDIRKLQELDVSLYKKQIRKLKRGKFWTAIAGTAATVGAFWLGTQL